MAFWVMGFKTPFGVSTPVSSVDMTAVTHISHVGMNTNSDGSLTSIRESGTTAPLISAAHAAGVKVLLNIQPSANTASAVDSHLSTYVTNITNVVNSDGYDGVDMDWEIGGTLARYQAFFPALRTAFGSSLLIAVDALATQFDLAQVLSSLDMIFVMTYDMSDNYGISWFGNGQLGNYTGYGGDAPGIVCSLEGAIDVWLHHISPAATLPKLGMGLAFFGTKSVGGSPVITGPRQTTSNNSTKSLLSYNDMLSGGYDLSGKVWDDEAGNYWVATPSPSGWIDYNDATAIAAKAQYIKDSGCGGLIFWTIENDYIVTENPTHPLMNAIKIQLGMGADNLQAKISGTVTIKANVLAQGAATAKIQGTSQVGAYLTNPSSNLTTGLTGFWELGEASGTRADSTAQANHLTDVTSAGQSTGIVGNAVHFTKASSQFLYHDSIASLQPGPDMSISAWVYFDSLGATPLSIAAKNSFTTANNAWLLYGRDSGAGFRLEIYDGQGNSQTASGPTPVINTWYHVIATYTDSDKIARIYVNNGSVNASSALTNGINVTGTVAFSLGCGNGGGSFPLDGRLDQVGYWQRVLTTNERSQLYNNGVGLSYSQMLEGSVTAQINAVVSGSSAITARLLTTGTLIAVIPIPGTGAVIANLRGTGAMAAAVGGTGTLTQKQGSSRGGHGGYHVHHGSRIFG